MSGPFIRKNALVASAVFTPEVGSAQPSSANCVLSFNTLAGALTQVNLPMTSSTSTVDDDVVTTWSVTWDSSAAGEGIVSWMIFSEGSVQAASQGEFMLLANAANNV